MANPHNPVTITGIDSVTGQPTTITVINGAASVVNAAAESIIYTDGTYTYYCETYTDGSALYDTVYQVTRETIATGRYQVASGGYTNPATDIAAVAALTYGA